MQLKRINNNNKISKLQPTRLDTRPKLSFGSLHRAPGGTCSSFHTKIGLNLSQRPHRLALASQKKTEKKQSLFRMAKGSHGLLLAQNRHSLAQCGLEICQTPRRLISHSLSCQHPEKSAKSAAAADPAEKKKSSSTVKKAATPKKAADAAAGKTPSPKKAASSSKKKTEQAVPDFSLLPEKNEKKAKGSAKRQEDIFATKLRPHFYDHMFREQSSVVYDITGAEPQNKMLNVYWGDSHTSRFHFIWLRDNCHCHLCKDPSSLQKMHNSADVPTNLVLTSLRLEEDKLVLEWGDRHKSWYPIRWLRNHCYQLSQLYRNALFHRRSEILWDRELFPTEFPAVAYADFMKSEFSRWNWMKAIQQYGLVLIRDAPIKDLTVKAVAEKIALLRNTMYGTTWQVKNKPGAENIAYSTVFLDFHQDLLYYQSPPGIQLLHCIANKATGGENLFADGFAIAERFRQEDPTGFQILSTHPTSYIKLGHDHFQYGQKPIIQLNNQQQIVGFNYSPYWEGPQAVPFKNVLEYYAAYRSLVKIIRSSEMAVVNRLEPGDIVAFNNRRILHSRTQYSNDERHLEGCYIDTEDFHSAYTVAEAKFEPILPK